MSILNKVAWIDAQKLTKFILSAQVSHRLRLPDTSLWRIQDPEGGGIADRPGDMVDVFHTQFGVAGMFPEPS